MKLEQRSSLWARHLPRICSPHRSTYAAEPKELWPYQVTPAVAPLSEKLANKLYDSSGGIPAYVTKIFWESQAQALLHGQSKIDEKNMQRAIDVLAIKIPKTYSGGTHISDFSFVPGNEPVPAETSDITVAISALENHTETFEKEVPRLYANRRGRPASSRDPADLLVALKSGVNMPEQLRTYNLVEVFQPC